MQSELVALGARLEQLEASLQQAVREETRRASNEIRHTVSELGRRLALDLPQFLDRHRQLIVAELRPGGSAGGGPGAAGAAGDGPAAGTDPAAAAPTDEAGATVGSADDEPSSDESGGVRRKRRRRKDG